MKKLFFLSAMIGLMAGTAAAVEIYSCNTVGVQRVTGTISEVSVPVPFVGIGGQDATLKSLLYIDNLSTGDSIQICQSNKYGFYNVWTAVNIPLAGVVDYYGSTRTMNTTEGAYPVVSPEADEAIIHRGTGIKLTHGSVSSSVYVMGEYTEVPLTTTVKAKTQYYLVNPLDTEFDLDAKLTSAGGVSELDDSVRIGDKIYYYRKNGEGEKHWYCFEYSTVDGKTTSKRNYVQPKIPSGGEFVYVRGAKTDLTFSW